MINLGRGWQAASLMIPEADHYGTMALYGLGKHLFSWYHFFWWLMVVDDG